MAESSPTEKGESVAEEPEDTLIQSGEVIYKGKAHKLLLLKTGLRMIAPPVRDPKTGATIDNLAVVDVNWRDVVSATEPPVKKSRAAPKRAAESPAPEGTQTKSFVLNYIKRDKKTHKMRCLSVTLVTPQEPSDGWIMQIEEKRKEGKPQKLLIVINPIGGKGTGRQVFEKQVHPLFACAGVELVVKMTERHQHAIEIAKTFDVKSVDGVVVMGGDGLYMEMLHGLTLRKQEEEGVNFNDPEARLVPPTVRVGIIPAGTGNGVSGWLNGVIDVDTATLNVIRGELCQSGIFSIHESGKLVHYSGLLVANGFFSSAIKRTDELRWMKRARYPYVMLSTIVKKQHIYEYEIEVLKQPTEIKEDIKSEGRAAAQWTKLGTKRIVSSICFPMTFDIDRELLHFNHNTSTYDLLILDKASALDTIKLVLGFFKKERSALEKEFVELIKDIEGMRFQLVQKEEEGASVSRRRTELNELAKLLDVDGELVYLSAPKYEVRLHPQFLQVFCAPDVFLGETSDELQSS